MVTIFCVVGPDVVWPAPEASDLTDGRILEHLKVVHGSYRRCLRHRHVEQKTVFVRFPAAPLVYHAVRNGLTKSLTCSGANRGKLPRVALRRSHLRGVPGHSNRGNLVND